MSTETSEDLELFHYGIKGMKWGVRREEGPDGNVSSNPRVKARREKREQRRAEKKQERKDNWKKPVSEDAEVAGKARDRTKKHGTDALSNKELQGLVTRMNLEQQYTNLMDSGKAKSARRSGQAYISDILKDAGKEFATEALKWGANEGVKYAFNRWGPGGGGGGQTSTAYRVPTNLIEGARKQIGR